MTIIVDTNVLVRLVGNDNETQSNIAVETMANAMRVVILRMA